MRNNSLISTEAGNNGNGGNIDIDAELIVAVPAEDSDIVADAARGNGGNINITTQGILDWSSVHGKLLRTEIYKMRILSITLKLSLWKRKGGREMPMATLL